MPQTPQSTHSQHIVHLVQINNKYYTTIMFKHVSKNKIPIFDFEHVHDQFEIKEKSTQLKMNTN